MKRARDAAERAREAEERALEAAQESKDRADHAGQVSERGRARLKEVDRETSRRVKQRIAEAQKAADESVQRDEKRRRPMPRRAARGPRGSRRRDRGSSARGRGIPAAGRGARRGRHGEAGGGPATGERGLRGRARGRRGGAPPGAAARRRSRAAGKRGRGRVSGDRADPRALRGDREAHGARARAGHHERRPGVLQQAGAGRARGRHRYRGTDEHDQGRARRRDRQGVADAMNGGEPSMRFLNRKSKPQRLLENVNDSLDARRDQGRSAGRRRPRQGTEGCPAQGQGPKGRLVAGGLAGLTAGSAGISSLRRRKEGARDDS